MPTQIGNYTSKNIFHSDQGDIKPASTPATIKSNQNLEPGQAMAQITSSKLWVAFDATATDGSQFCRGILGEYVNTTSSGLNKDYGPVNIYRGYASYLTDQLVGVTALALRHLGGINLEGNKTEVACGKRPTVESPIGGLRLPVSAATDANYTGLATDTLVVWPSITAGREHSLPALADVQGMVVFIKAPSNANTNNLTINPNASETIDGGSTKVISTASLLLGLIAMPTEWRSF